MLQKTIGKIWQALPRAVRLKIIRTTQKKFTASVGAVILNEEGKFLLLDHVLRPSSGWGIPGGFMNPSEQPESAIKREIFEETGLELFDIKMIWVRTIGKHIEILFRAKGKGIASVKSREIRDLGWFEIESMPENMTEIQKSIVRKVLSFEL
jgi:ADP-ribose pyrophosphatase YjhB (NUDIX family)